MYLCSMNKFRIKIVVILSAISLIGIIFTQLFWVMNAISLAEDQFDHKVTMAIREALEELTDYTQAASNPEDGCSVSCPNAKYDKEYINTRVLDSLLTSRFLFYDLDSVFEYAIVECGTSSPLFEKTGIISDKLPVTCHKAGLSCIYKTECYNLEVYFPKKKQIILIGLMSLLGVSIFFMIIVAFSFGYIVTTIIKQKKTSEIKNDFINNMTHEFKTPIATISMASEVLISNENMTPERIAKYSKIIFEENKRLQLQVERVLETAIMDKRDFILNRDEEINLHELITQTVDHLCLEHCDKSVKLTYNLNADRPVLFVDRMHFKNVINNLIDNAYKYSEAKPEITISTKSNPEGFILQVLDNGIGMSNETMKNIFTKFYRKPTGDLHNVKGFGLGLYYVKSVVEQHGGKVSVDSSPGKGSTFTVFLPY